MRKLYKKAYLSIILAVILIIIVVGWIVSVFVRECTSNEECNANQYCGYDHKCHDHPIIEKEVTKNRLLGPSIILGLCIIIAAVILRYKRERITPKPGTNF